MSKYISTKKKSWLIRILERFTTRNYRAQGKQTNIAKLGHEVLEHLQVPAVLIVNSIADNVTRGDDLVTLREAIEAANNNTMTDLQETGVGSDIIVFDTDVFGSAQTILLDDGEINITSDIMI